VCTVLLEKSYFSKTKRHLKQNVSARYSVEVALCHTYWHNWHRFTGGHRTRPQARKARQRLSSLFKKRNEVHLLHLALTLTVTLSPHHLTTNRMTAKSTVAVNRVNNEELKPTGHSSISVVSSRNNLLW